MLSTTSHQEVVWSDNFASKDTTVHTCSYIIYDYTSLSAMVHVCMHEVGYVKSSISKAMLYYTLVVLLYYLHLLE